MWFGNSQMSCPSLVERIEITVFCECPHYLMTIFLTVRSQNAMKYLVNVYIWLVTPALQDFQAALTMLSCKFEYVLV